MDGYLAVSSLEKEFIGALRDSKLVQYGPSRSSSGIATSQSNAEISGKFNLFQKLFSGAVPQLSTLPGSVVNDARNALTSEEKRLYDEAAERLATMAQKFVSQEAGTSKDDGMENKEEYVD